MNKRTLVAGFGNVLRGDDGFGVVVVQQLREELDPKENVEVLEVGTGGLQMAQELLGGYERLVIVDAMTRRGTPGQIYVEVVEGVKSALEVDLHLAVPSRALSVAKALGALPPEVYIVGCEPQETEELSMELSQPVKQAVAAAVDHVLRLVGQTAAGAIARRDEMLELLYWLEGEGFAGSARLESIARFLAWPEGRAQRTLERLVGQAEVSRVDAEYKLTPTGRKEAARRFADDFAPFLAQGHGECSDPDCDCSAGGPAECRARLG